VAIFHDGAGDRAARRGGTSFNFCGDFFTFCGPPTSICVKFFFKKNELHGSGIIRYILTNDLQSNDAVGLCPHQTSVASFVGVLMVDLQQQG
jgi:hypothetical protein